MVEACHSYGHSFGATSHRRRLSQLAVSSPSAAHSSRGAAPGIVRRLSAPTLVDTRGSMSIRSTQSSRSSLTSPQPMQQPALRSQSATSTGGYSAPISRRASDVSMYALSPSRSVSVRKQTSSSSTRGSRRSVTRRASGLLAQQLLPTAANVTLLHGRRVLFHASPSTRVGDVFAFAARESGLTDDIGVFGLACPAEDGVCSGTHLTMRSRVCAHLCTRASVQLIKGDPLFLLSS